MNLYKRIKFRKFCRLWLLLSLALLFMTGLASCSRQTEDREQASRDINDIEADIKQEESLLEQAVDWCNANLFNEKQDYSLFTLEQRTAGDREYIFLLKQAAEMNLCELYYIQCEDDQVRKVRACGAGEKSLFSYEPVTIHEEEYVAVYCADEKLEGDLKLFPLNDEGKVYVIEGVIDYNRENTIEEYRVKHAISRVFSAGKLKAKFRDLTFDIYTDIRLNGYIYEYIQYPWDDHSMLTNIYEYTRTYYFDEDLMQFVFKDEKEKIVYSRYPSICTYSGYLDVHPETARDNPAYDYDGDGLLDRIYKEVDIYSGESSFYIYFGNGNMLFLAGDRYCQFYRTKLADITGDGRDEIIFVQVVVGTGMNEEYYSIARYKDGGYEIMDFPYYMNYKPKGKLYLQLVINKLNDNTLSVYQPDTGFKGNIITEVYTFDNGEIFDEMEHIYQGLASDSPNETHYYPVSEMILIDTGENGRKALQLCSYIGDKWCQKGIDWRLEYISGEWKITDVYLKK